MDVDLTTLRKNDKKDTSNQRWTREQEELLASWSERASGYRWLHSRSEKLYRCRNYTFTIPVIILSTLTGTANFAMDSFVPEENKQIAMACVGGVNIFAGVLSTLQNFLRYAELMESHRVAEVSWSKLSRDIAVELTLEPKMRKPAFDFLNVCRAEYDRLIEQSPPIDDDIIKRYKNEFNKLEHDFNHPHVCNGLHKCKIFENKEEQKINTVVAAGEKFMNIKKQKWNNNVDTEFKRMIKVIPEKFEKPDINEELKSLNKVSQFKKSFMEDKNIDNDKHPMEKINEIIKCSQKDIEIGITDNNLEKETDDIPIQELDNKSVNEDNIVKVVLDDIIDDSVEENNDEEKQIKLKIDFLDKKD